MTRAPKGGGISEPAVVAWADADGPRRAAANLLQLQPLPARGESLTLTHQDDPRIHPNYKLVINRAAEPDAVCQRQLGEYLLTASAHKGVSDQPRTERGALPDTVPSVAVSISSALPARRQ